MLIAGYDSGGGADQGIALLEATASAMSLTTAGVDSVDEAMAWLEQLTAGRTIDAAGVDTMLSWATGRSGWRPIDLHLRQTYPVVKNSVFSSNSAYGSMAVQGMAFAMRLRAEHSEIQLNEAHPKVLYHALSGGQVYAFGPPLVSWLAALMPSATPASSHEWDAAISAWATYQGLTRAWQTDLMIVAGSSSLLLPTGRVTYYWP